MTQQQIGRIQGIYNHIRDLQLLNAFAGVLEETNTEEEPQVSQEGQAIEEEAQPVPDQPEQVEEPQPEEFDEPRE